MFSSIHPSPQRKSQGIQAAVALVVALTAAWGAQAQPVVRNQILTDAAGRTLYVFDKDTVGKSNCAGACLAAWPAHVAKEGATAQGDFTLIDAHGAKQWAFKGMPLYYFAGDAQPGDRHGDGSGGVWHVVPGTAVGTTAAKPQPTSGYSGY